MEKQLEELQRQFSQDLEKIHKPEEVEPLRIQYLGRKGRLTAVLRQMGSLGAEERPRMGALSNKLKAFMEQALEEKSTALASEQAATGIDVTLPGRVLRRGSIHVINQVMEEIEDIFRHLGFQIASGPEVEDDYHNFEALNMPENHPARDMQDTFYFSKGTLLRTHTSPVQIRVMEAQGLPVRIIAPGKVYRCDFDITHSPMFHQVEGL